MDDGTEPASQPEPHLPLWDLVLGWWGFTAVYAWVQLGGSDQLRDGPLAVAELARRCDAHAPSLRRLLRLLASLGVVDALGTGAYDLTDVGRALCSDTPGSFHPAVTVMGEKVSYEAMGRLTEIVRTGRSPIANAHGSIWDYRARDPELNAAFGAYMTSRSQAFASGLVASTDFSQAGTLVDVGGGQGTIIAELLAAHPKLRGVLVEREEVVPHAKRYLAGKHVTDRCEVVAGDFFESVPAGKDVYLLANVTHNWDDADVVRILRTIRRAMPPAGRLVLIDLLLPDSTDRPHFAITFDIRMLAMFGAAGERTRTDYLDLLRRSDLTSTRIVEVDPVQGSHVIEARPSGT